MAAEDRRAASRIFISYRRGDSHPHVNALLSPLRHQFGEERVFKDTDNIAPGQDFVKVIRGQLKLCSVLLAVIGKQWLTAKKPNSEQRRLDDPKDYLRVEIATALNDEGILVIPVLVGDATMPDLNDLPPDLASLSTRNAFELRDSRWESDVRLLIESIEQARAQDPSSVVGADSAGLNIRTADAAPATDAEELDLLETRRKRQLADHLESARLAFEAGDYDGALKRCEQAIWLDPKNRDARDLRRRSRARIDEFKISEWLGQARMLLQPNDLPEADLVRSSEFVDKALALSGQHEEALKLRQEILSLRKRREREQEAEGQVRTALASARASLDAEDYDAAIEHCNDALALRSDNAEAAQLRETALSARHEERRLRQVKRQAQKTIAEARAEFAAGHHTAAISRLEQFIPTHDLITTALEELRRELTIRERRVSVDVASQDYREVTALKTLAPAPTPTIPPEPKEPNPEVTPLLAANPRTGSSTRMAAFGMAATVVVFLGMWMISKGDAEPDEATRKAAAESSVPPQGSASPQSGNDGTAAGTNNPAPAPPQSPRLTSDTGLQSTIPSGASAGRSSDTLPPQQSPSVPVRVGGTIKAPRKLTNVPPIYPPIAQAARLQGVVVIEATIGTDGRVTKATVLRSIPLLDQAALDAVKQWEFSQTTLNSVPVEVIMTVTVNFTLN